MTYFTAPAQPLTDGVVTLRLPSAEAGDVEAVRGYIEQEQLDGGWLPEIPLVFAEQVIGDWLDAWTTPPAAPARHSWSRSHKNRGSSASSAW